MERKKKILIQTDFSLAKTGFGRSARAILKNLYLKNKYDIVHYACGMTYNHPDFGKTPWKTVGSLPNTQQELDQLNRDPHLARMASYGAHLLDKVINEEKPDVYIAVQDIWGVDFAIEKPWFNKINSVIWTTLDSLPILESAIQAARKVKNYWIWSDFATKALHKLGFPHVKTLHGALENKDFYRLSDFDRNQLRKRNNIPPDAFVIGFVFRNQLRKSVPNLLQGYALWKKQNPEIKNTYLLLHTHWGEGWNIHKLAGEIGVNPQEILTTYVCKNCGEYEVKPFSGQDLNCRFCKSQKTQITTNVGLGVSEEKLNEIYNLMDIYCHPFTSGGQEIPIQEAKLTELITLVTNYSCGEEMCEKEAHSLSLEWSEYREHGTEFIKASTSPESIAKNLNIVYKMPIQKRKEMGAKAREWTIKNFGVENICKQIESFIDSKEFIDWSKISESKEEKDPYFQIPEIPNNIEWLLFMYHNILKMKEVDQNDDGCKYWMNELSKGAKRQDIENYFRNVAVQENQKLKKINFEDLLDQNDKGKRILYVMPESIGDIFLSTSLFENIKKQYPEYNLYVAVKQEYFEILDGNPHIHRLLNYIPQMDQLIWLEGSQDHKGYFEIAFLPHVGTQRFLDYLHNGKTNIQFNIKD
ncbi:MAG: glycosyltransferase [Caulobacteraceae bacterium]|nr:glycosyltransferase [Caulobacteraceae bacterium]